MAVLQMPLQNEQANVKVEKALQAVVISEQNIHRNQPKCYTPGSFLGTGKSTSTRPSCTARWWRRHPSGVEKYTKWSFTREMSSLKKNGVKFLVCEGQNRAFWTSWSRCCCQTACSRTCTGKSSLVETRYFFWIHFASNWVIFLPWFSSLPGIVQITGKWPWFDQ